MVKMKDVKREPHILDLKHFKTDSTKFQKKCTRTDFGLSFDLDMPKGCGLIIVAINKGQGLIPVNLLLPHQLYKKDVNELIRKHGLDHEFYGEVVVIPVDHRNYMTIWGTKTALEAEANTQRAKLRRR